MTKPAVYTGRRQWALEVLGIDEGADPQAVRRGIQQRLNECSLVPPPPWREAIDILTRGVTKTTWFERAYESRLRERIGDFSGRLWSMSREQRKGESVELSELAQGYPALMFRMQELSAANEMGLETETIEDPRVRELAELGKKSLILAPGERHAHWRAWAAAHADDTKGESREWKEAAVCLRERYAALYALAYERFDMLRTEAIKVGPLKIGTRRRGSYARYWGPLALLGAIVVILWVIRGITTPEPVPIPKPPDRQSVSQASKRRVEQALAVDIARRRFEAARKAAETDSPEFKPFEPQVEELGKNSALRKLFGIADSEELLKELEEGTAKVASPGTDSDAPATTFMITPNGVAKRLPDGTWAPATQDEIPKGVLPEPPVKEKDSGGSHD